MTFRMIVPLPAVFDVLVPIPVGVPWEALVVMSPAGTEQAPEGVVQYSKVTLATIPVVAVVKSNVCEVAA